MGGIATRRNSYALQFGTIGASDFLDGIAGANGDTGDGADVFRVFGVVHVNRIFSYDVPIFQTLTANITKGNFEGVDAFNFIFLIICGLLLDCQPAGFDGVDVFYL